MRDQPRPCQDHITADPEILAGKPIVASTRITVDLVLDELAQNPDTREFLATYPDLTLADVQACLAYKALATGEEVTPKPQKAGATHAPQGKRMIEFYSPTGPAFGRHSSNERGSLRLVRSHPM